MNYRTLGRTGWKVSDISFGAWAIGGFWGQVSEPDALATLHKAIDCGVNFIDTADVYGMGRSERLIARLRKERKDKEEIIVATKAGRRLPKQTVEGYSRKNLAGWLEDSLRNLNTDTIDLLQLHCPPTELYEHAEVFSTLDDFVKEGKLRFYGVSVEKVEEALKAIAYPNVQSVQIIFNCFPLASGMLTGKLRRDSTFPKDDHRNFNRHGEMFDVGETFSGVDYDLGLRAVDELARLVPAGMSMTQFALRWILMFDAVTCAIPGGKRPGQVADNCHASDLPALPAEAMAGVKRIYEGKIRATVHSRW